jgi:hydroxymethylpyrimidine pyrophosphatase-like HAD family hydrolase
MDGDDRLLIHERIADWEWFLKVYAVRRVITDAPLRDADGAPFFLAFMGDPDVADAGAEVLRPLAVNGHMLFTYRFVNWPLGMVVLRPDVTKGEGLRLLTEREGIERSAVTAIGDWRNDVTMIDWAGTGVAMPRSAPEVMEVADVVLPTSCEEDGVAEYLEELLGV